MQNYDKSYALIDGLLQEYDVCLNSLDTVHRINDTEYEYLGYGTIDNVCGVRVFGNNYRYFYRKIVEKKRERW